MLKNRIVTLVSCAALLVGIASPRQSHSQSPELAGHWRGELIRDGYVWNLWVDIQQTDGPPTVKVSYPDWGMFLLGTRDVRLDGSELNFQTAWLEASFELRAEGEFMSGTFVRSGTSAAARLHRQSSVSRILRSEPFAITADDGGHLEGSLILPEGDPPYAGIVMTHGSGPDTRTTGPYIGKANRAALSGLAVAAYDKRGAGASTGSGSHQIERLGADAKLMLDYLRADPRVDGARVGIGGISQGAWVAPKVAAEDSAVAFVFVTATPGISPAEQNVFSLRNRLGSEDFKPDEVRDAITALRRVYEYYRVGTEAARMDAVKSLESGAGSWADTPVFRRFLFMQGDSLESEVSVAAYATMFVDPLAWWREITVPVLSAWGADDWNVPARYSHDVVEAALRDAGNQRGRLIVFPNAGHGLSAEDLPKEDWPRAAPGYVETMADWFAERAAGDR